MEQANTPKIVSFRWSFVALPLAMLLISIVLAVIFYGRLSPEVAYRFSNGHPVSSASRGALLGWSLGLQLVFTLLSLAMTALVTYAARRMQVIETPLNKMLFAIIGNVVALPQIIIAYAVLDIFLYNIYVKSLPSLWAFALLVMVVGGAILAVLFARAMAQSRKLKLEKPTGSESDAR